MKRFIENKYKIWLITLVILFVCSLRIIFSYSEGINRFDCHDFLEGIRWAQGTITEGGFPLSNKIAYYYTVPFGSNYLIAPFLLLNINLLLSNQLGMLVWFLLYLYSLFCLASSLFDDKTKRLQFCSISLLWIFTYVGDNMLHHLLVYGISLVCFNYLFAIGINAEGREYTKIEIISLFLISIYSAMNGFACFVLSGGGILNCCFH